MATSLNRHVLSQERIYQAMEACRRMPDNEHTRRLKTALFQQFRAWALGYFPEMHLRQAWGDTNYISGEYKKFKNEVSKRYALISGDPHHQSTWCCITQELYTPEECKMTQLFPALHGPATMESIFGKIGQQCWSWQNGLLLSSSACLGMNKYLFAIVPALDDTAPNQDYEHWYKRLPHEYKIKVFDFDHEAVTSRIPFSGRCWKDLHDEQLDFVNENRPRTRFLCWRYLQAACYWAEKGFVVKNPFWGTLATKWFCHDLIFGFAEALRVQEPPPDYDEVKTEENEGILKRALGPMTIQNELRVMRQRLGSVEANTQPG